MVVVGRWVWLSGLGGWLVGPVLIPAAAAEEATLVQVESSCFHSSHDTFIAATSARFIVLLLMRCAHCNVQLGPAEYELSPFYLLLMVAGSGRFILLCAEGKVHI